VFYSIHEKPTKVKGGAMEAMDKGSCLVGAICGFVFAGVAAVILSGYWEAQTKMGLRNRTLDNFPASAQPKLTPSGIVDTSVQARVRAILWVIAFILLVLVAMAIAYLLLGEG
jgi:hypothetical protein